MVLVLVCYNNPYLNIKKIAKKGPTGPVLGHHLMSNLKQSPDGLQFLLNRFTNISYFQISSAVLRKHSKLKGLQQHIVVVSIYTLHHLLLYLIVQLN